MCFGVYQRNNLQQRSCSTGFSTTYVFLHRASHGLRLKVHGLSQTLTASLDRFFILDFGTSWQRSHGVTMKTQSSC